MALQPIVAAGDGPRVTVDTLVKTPNAIPKRVIQMMDQRFMSDVVLRNGGTNPSGVTTFFESTPLFLDGEPAEKGEFGEYRVLTSSDGQQRVVTGLDRGFSIVISERMRRRNQMDRVSQMMIQGRNTMVRTWDTIFRAAVLNHPGIPTMTIGDNWDTVNGNIRSDILAGKTVVSEQTDSLNTSSFLGFNPDTIIMSIATGNMIIGNEKYGTVYRGNIASESLAYKGVLPSQFEGLTPLVSPWWPNDKILICERNTLGFIQDERGLQSTPLYEDKKTETWRSDTSRISIVGIDQPKAGVILTGFRT